MKRGLRLAARAHAAISLLALLALGAPAAAHTRSMSWSTWQLLPDGARIELRLKQIELTREPPGYRWATALPTELRLFAGDAACAADDATQLSSAPEGWAVFRWRVRCEGSGPRRIESRLLAESAAAHTHFLRIAGPADGAGESIRERVLMTGRDDA